VMALKPRHGTWAYGPDAHTPADAARALARGGPEDPGDWQPVTRAFRGGHTGTWRAADATLGWWGLTEPPAWWSPLPTRALCRTRPPGTWPPTCPGPGPPARAAGDTRYNQLQYGANLHPARLAAILDPRSALCISVEDHAFPKVS
jgi:hypothetical protein